MPFTSRFAPLIPSGLVLSANKLRGPPTACKSQNPRLIPYIPNKDNNLTCIADKKLSVCIREIQLHKANTKKKI